MNLYKKKEDGSYEEVSIVKSFETQEDLDNFMKERVERAEKKVKEQFSDYDTLKSGLDEANKKLGEFDSTKKSLEEQLAEKAKEVESEKLNSVRAEVRTEYGLSKEFDRFLTGDTPEDIKSAAEILKKNGTGASFAFQKENEEGEAAESPSKELANGLFGSNQ